MLTISISRATSGCYLWALGNGADVFVDGGDPENSVAGCLSSAAGYLSEEPLVVISYRGVTVGTVVASRLSHDTASVADWVIACFGKVVHALD